MPRFFYGSLLQSGTEITLSAEESHHLAKVLRLEAGAVVEVFDGLGTTAEAWVGQVSPRASRLRLGAVRHSERASKIELAFGLPKGPALDFILRRTAEVGLRRLSPLLTQHSQRVHSWNAGRWSKVLHEVGKQCQSPFLPELGEPAPLSQWLARRNSKSCLVICDENERAPSSPLPPRAPGYELLIGSEGGWSREEITSLKAAGAISMGLGENRLRAETAALVGLVLLKKLTGEV